MALNQYPLDKSFLVAAWLESLVYGCLLVVFVIHVYIHANSAKHGQSSRNQVMFIISTVMFIIATIHVAINCFRLIRGFVEFRLAFGGPVGYLRILSLWDHAFKDILYVTQCVIGNAAAVYRCWLIWARNYRVVFLPFLLLLVSIASGYLLCGLSSATPINATTIDPRIGLWYTIFFSVVVAQNLMTSGLMALRIWRVEKDSARFRLGRGHFLPVLKIMVESAALYLFVETLLLALNSVHHNAQFIVLECVTPIVGLTFTVMTIRIKLRSQNNLAYTSTTRTGELQAKTIGSIPVRPIVIGRHIECIDDASTSVEGFGKERVLENV